MLIKSSKYIFNYLDNVCECTALPFDHPDTVRLPKHGNIEVSLYQTTKANHNFRYIGEDGILKILKLNLVYNYCPIPLNICGKFV